MAADKGKEVVPPVVLINQLEDLKRQLEAGGVSSALMQNFAELKQKFSASATAAREAGNKGLTQVFVKDVSPLMKEVEGKISEKNQENTSKVKIETLPRSSKNRWGDSKEGIDKSLQKVLEQKRTAQPSKVAEQKLDSPRPSFKMGGHRTG